MADDWEDWEQEDFTPPPLATGGNGAVVKTKGQVELEKAAEPDASKFAGEDEEEAPPAWQAAVPKSQQPKEKKKTYEEKGKVEHDQPLDDPIAEKMRQQRLVEEADFQATMELFGGAEVADIDPATFVPKSAKEHEDLARALALRHLLPYRATPHYKAMLKAVVKVALGPLTVQEVKDLEASIAGLRSEKLKAEKEAAALKKAAGKKKTLNVGKSGGSAGLEDYQYGEAPLDDDYDFM